MSCQDVSCADEFNFCLEIGGSRKLYITLDGVEDWTGYQLRLQIRHASGTAVLCELSTDEDGGITFDGETVVMDFTGKTGNVTPGIHKQDLFVLDPDERPDWLWYGVVECRRPITVVEEE